jgi:DNA-directed RNA polymerase specialized sigma24 family protein
MAGPPRDASTLRREHFASLYEENFTDIYAYVLRRVGAVEVSDVVQEAFVSMSVFPGCSCSCSPSR